MKLICQVFILNLITLSLSSQNVLLNNIDSANFYYKNGNYKKSNSFANTALQLSKKEDANYYELQNLIALNDFELSQFDSAQNRLEKLLPNIEKKKAKYQAIYLKSLRNLAMVLYSIKGEKNINKSDSLLQYCLAHQVKKTIQDSVELAQIYHLIGRLNEERDESKKSENYYVSSLRIDTLTKNITNETHANTLGSLGTMYLKSGNLKLADKFTTKSLELFKSIKEPNLVKIASSLTNLASIKYMNGNLPEAMKNCEESRNMLEQSIGADNVFFARNLDLLAVIYDEYGANKQTEPMYLECLRIYDQNSMHKSEEYVSALINLAGLYKDHQQFQKAEEKYMLAYELTIELEGVKSMKYVEVCNNIGHLYGGMHETTKAAKYLDIALNTLESIAGKGHFGYSIILANIARLYYDDGDYLSAVKYMKESYQLNNELSGIKTMKSAALSSNLLGLYTITDNFNDGLPLYQEQIKSLTGFFTSDINLLNQNDILQFIKRYYKRYESLSSFLLKCQPKSNGLTAELFNLHILIKNISFQKIKTYKSFSEETSDSLVKKMFYELSSLNKKLTTLYAIPKSERKLNIDSLSDIYNSIDTKLVNRITLVKDKNLVGKFASDTVNWVQVKNALLPGDATVEFINFEKLNKGWTDTIVYCALVIKPEYEQPKMVYICTEYELKGILEKQKQQSEFEYIYNLYAANGKGNELYKLVWKPMDSLFYNTDRIYLAKAGLLNQLSFSAIPIQKNKILSDKYQLSNLSCSKELIGRKKLNIADIKQVNLYGGISFSKDSMQIAMMKDFSRDFFPGSLKEVKEINNILQKHPLNINIFKGKEGSEKSLKQNKDNLLSILHISTHGFYFPPKELSKFINDTKFDSLAFENELNRSGLLFSEIENINNNKVNGEEDGILTALEISNLSMPHVKLAVLSACQTGLGDFSLSTEVTGQIRAFKLAGVDKLIVSLWKVPDDATQMVFKLMYKHFASDSDIESALKKAQNEIRLTEKYGNVYYWAGFVLID